MLFKISSGSISAVVHQMLSKSENIFTEMWSFNDFQNGGRPPSWILKNCSFCHVTFVDMPFCFLLQNFAEIGQPFNELWPKERFSRWRPSPSWIFKMSILGHVTVIRFIICCSVPNFIKIGRFVTEIWRFNDFKIAVVAMLDFKNLQILSWALVDMPFCFLIQNFAKSDNCSMSYGYKSDFQDGVLEF